VIAATISGVVDMAVAPPKCVHPMLRPQPE
jgi:hypothetical protein